MLQDTRDIKDIGTVRGFGVDEDVALVVTDLYTQPIGTVNNDLIDMLKHCMRLYIIMSSYLNYIGDC